MKPEQVRLHHFRDWHWRTKYCDRCKCTVTKWHEHHTRKGYAVSALATGKNAGREEPIE